MTVQWKGNQVEKGSQGIGFREQLNSLNLSGSIQGWERLQVQIRVRYRTIWGISFRRNKMVQSTNSCSEGSSKLKVPWLEITGGRKSGCLCGMTARLGVINVMWPLTSQIQA